MKKPLIALTAAALALVAAGCTPASENTNAGTGETSATASPAPGSASPTASGSASPGTSTTTGASPSASSTTTASPSSTSSAIADGFPTNLVPVMPGSTPLTTSFEETSKLFTASLSATTDAPAKEILAFYAKTFTAQGFTPADPEVRKTATVQQFSRSGADDTANVTVVPREGGFTYTASINTLPESAK
ncbi:hypothetical protein ABIB35_002914 [Arthrobacter sp. UYP6]|uniref:hypothetical protein n=1 Tax=Arthrobacter sp. UYP6 TaxID=1756378 RepID=UPI003392C5C1